MLITTSLSMSTLSCHKWLLPIVCLLLCRACESVTVNYYNISTSGNAAPSLYFDFDTNNSRLIVGATNQVFNLDFELTTRTNVVDYDANNSDAYSSCISDGFDYTKCQNLHHLVRKTNGSGQITGDNSNTTYTFNELVLMCSSHAYNQECIYRRISDLEPVKTFSAKGFIPIETNPSLPALLLEDNTLISAPDLNRADRQSRFVAKSTAPFVSMENAVSGLIEENWFVEPNFVSIHEIGDYIYFFFREKAKEEQRNVYYSRVARVCKSDAGTSHHGRLIFSTFEKARITCDKGIKGTYFYDEIQDTYYNKEEQLLYAVFNSARYGPVGSAVCVYSFNISMNDLYTVFEGKFFNQTGLNTLTPTNVNGSFGCQRELSSALKYQLIMNRTKSVNTTPLVGQDGYTFRRMVPPISVNDYHVLFIVASKQSASGLYVMKYIKKQSESTYTLLQEIHLPYSVDTSYITSMVLFGVGADAHIYIGTVNGIYRLPVQSCGDHVTCSSCVFSGDPYCTYDSTEKKCKGVFYESGQVPQESNATTLCEPVKSTDGTTNQPTSTTTKEQMFTFQTVSGHGLETSLKDELKGNVWIIVGSVCGFVGGVVIGMVISAMFRRYISRRGKYRCSSVASSCELASGSRNNSATVAPLKLHSVIVNPTDSRPDHLMNNSTSSTTSSSSKNFTRSSDNDYSHLPANSGTDSCKKIPPSPPLKSYPSVSPTKSSESEDSGIIGMAKCSDICTPSPKEFSQPTPTKSTTPQSSGCKQQGGIFKFDPMSIKMNSSSEEASGLPAARRGTDPNLVSEAAATVPRRGTDPNLKSNYRQNVHLTNQQRQNYGRNILARYPSVDGSKSKYLPNEGSNTFTPPSRRPPPVHPKPLSTRTVLQLEDIEGGSSQC